MVVPELTPVPIDNVMGLIRERVLDGTVEFVNNDLLYEAINRVTRI